MSPARVQMIKKILCITLVVVACLAVVALVLWISLRNYAPTYNQPASAAPIVPSLVAPPPDSPIARGMWPEHPEQDDRALVLVAISGGGTRAAAVGWRALETLRTVPYRFKNAAGQTVESNLGTEVDLIAGISGGSFTATAWCLGQNEMQRFRKNFIERDIQKALAGIFTTPKGVLALFSCRYSRINFAAEIYDQEVFDQKTFAALPDRPLLRLHATNLALGQRFTFTPETFAAIASNLSSYPLGYACAASSAFPILLNPMTLRNYPPALDLKADLGYQSDKQNAREDLHKDLQVRTRDYYNEKQNAYLHLADGGLVDNQGLQSILDEFQTNGLINRRINYTTPSLQRLIIININAGVAPPSSSGRSAAPPGVFSVVESTMVSSMDVLSERRWMDIKSQCRDLMSAKIDVGATTPSYAELEEPYRVEISFRNIEDPGDFQKAMDLPTSFHLTSDELSLVDRVVPVLLNEDPEFKRLNEALGN
jgi:NTE family protein